MGIMILNKLFWREYAKHALRSEPLIRHCMNEVDSLYAMTTQQLACRNNDRFMQLFKTAYEKSSFYHQLYESRGVTPAQIHSLDDLHKLPVITKEDVRKHAQHMRVSPTWRLLSNRTSGTTGTPLRIYEEWHTVWIEEAYLKYYRKKCGFNHGHDLLVSIRGQLDRKHQSIYIPNSHCLFLSSFNMNEHTGKHYYNLVKQYSPRAIEGYPSAIYRLCQVWDKLGLYLQIPLTFTSSETLTPQVRAYIEHFLHTSIFDHYGNTERSTALSETFNHQGYFEVPGYGINEFQEQGIITTSLINPSFPLIRYQVDDKVTLCSNHNSCSVIAPIAQSIDGRTSQAIVGKDGTPFNGASLTYLAKNIPNAQVVQLVQDNVGCMTVNIVPANATKSIDMNKTHAIINKLMGGDNIDCTIKIITSNQLIYSTCNKLQFIVNRCSSTLSSTSK